MDEIDLYEEDTELSDLTEFELDAPTRGRGRPRKPFDPKNRTTEELAAIELAKAAIDQCNVESVLGVRDRQVMARSKTGQLLTTEMLDRLFPDLCSGGSAMQVRSQATKCACNPHLYNWTVVDQELDAETESEIKAESASTWGW